ncbi:MAG: SGNH/GDSL hydrolase family protein [Eubacteriales bacterium]|nr:SGNH/GDSL hydrolase family protein [Eubacteriales bacterium]
MNIKKTRRMAVTGLLTVTLLASGLSVWAEEDGSDAGAADTGYVAAGADAGDAAPDPGAAGGDMGGEVSGGDAAAGQDAPPAADGGTGGGTDAGQTAGDGAGNAASASENTGSGGSSSVSTSAGVNSEENTDSDNQKNTAQTASSSENETDTADSAPVFVPEQVEVNEQLQENLAESAPRNTATDGWLSRTAARRGSIRESVNGRKVIMIGDSRAVGMGMAVDPEAETCIWSCLGGMGYNWMVSQGVPAIESLIDGKTDIIVSMGVNDAWDGMADEFLPRYVEYMNAKALEWKKLGARTYYVSVNPIRQQYQLGQYLVDDNSVVYWNTYMKRNLSSDVIWIETYETIRDHVDYADDIHYRDTTYKEIYDLMLQAASRGNAEEEGVERSVNAVTIPSTTEASVESEVTKAPTEEPTVEPTPAAMEIPEAEPTPTPLIKTGAKTRVFQVALLLSAAGAAALFVTLIAVIMKEIVRRKKRR